MTQEPIITMEHVKQYFEIRDGKGKKGTLKAVDDVSLTVNKGETFGIVGESGCGKSTLGKTMLNLGAVTDGTIIIDGQDVSAFKNRKEKIAFGSKVQLVFQDPSACLNPRNKIRDILAEPFQIHHKKDMTKVEIEAEIDRLLTMVGLAPDYKKRYPHEMSGGQKQRIGIARALALKPDIIICDEPVSALDVSIQAQVINLLVELQEQMNLTYFFISHDLGVVYHLCDRIAVMYLGNVVELADRDALYKDTLHPYTKALISAAPTIDKEKTERIVLTGDVPSPANPPKGCKFHTRCPFAMEKCKTVVPELMEVKDNHFVACHLHDKKEETEAP
ncbi:ATP-binding cassette domain-containing protein [Enterococcus sp. MJM16]|uniref:ATP-binding cassette domain-containing protein n=2 Tax=Candidatus Enterococcus murrayae TaxID=2815321 RepID=A0ABS3HFG2_9ENTE|nr:oligopeptide/dipeptide ABC transporter ATP-binding protein [Enterococcus sp. MJM16]MBO0451988.1 ATP-binding cassette domain-containing protein [Enterococcus sp. MJM16]